MMEQHNVYFICHYRCLDTSLEAISLLHHQHKHGNQEVLQALVKKKYIVKMKLRKKNKILLPKEYKQLKQVENQVNFCPKKTGYFI